MKIYEGNLVANGIRVGVVCARFNEFIVSKLLSCLLYTSISGSSEETMITHLPALTKSFMTW